MPKKNTIQKLATKLIPTILPRLQTPLELSTSEGEERRRLENQAGSMETVPIVLTYFPAKSEPIR